MDGFVRAFFEIDKSRKEWVSEKELSVYMKENDLDEEFVERWQTLFDPEKTGRIELDKFCEVLGLHESTVREQFDAEELKDIEIISTDMDSKDQIRVVRIVQKAFIDIPNDDKEMVRSIKKELDRLQGRIWHVVIVCGRYNSYYSYETKFNFCFKLKERIFIVYRTPDPELYAQ